MSEPITLEEAKMHLRVDHYGDDLMIQSLIEAARNHVENELGASIDDISVTFTDGTSVTISGIVRSAILLTLGYLYEHRGDEDKPIPAAVAALLNLSPHRQRLGAA
jgi:hypothetical protein